jgi:hypothetical protein
MGLMWLKHLYEKNISANGSTIPEAAESGLPEGRSDQRERSGIVC